MCEAKRALRLSLAAAVLEWGLTLAGGAQAEVLFSTNVAMTTDYLVRGMAQAGESPAIQGGFDDAHSSGCYLGTWASNVNYGSEASSEIDYYVGYAGDASLPLNETFALDWHYGYTFVDTYGFWTDGEAAYADYRIGPSTSFGGVDVSLNDVGTTISGLDAAENRLMVAISKSF